MRFVRIATEVLFFQTHIAELLRIQKSHIQIEGQTLEDGGQM